VDVILDPVGAALLDLDLSIAAPGGRVVLFGNAAGGAQPPLPPAGRLIGGNVGVLGFSMSRLSATAPKAVASALAKGLEMIAAARIRIPARWLPRRRRGRCRFRRLRRGACGAAARSGHPR
jgi:NADPH2:quinone reductase